MANVRKKLNDGFTSDISPKIKAITAPKIITLIPTTLFTSIKLVRLHSTFPFVTFTKDAIVIYILP